MERFRIKEREILRYYSNILKNEHRTEYISVRHTPKFSTAQIEIF